MKKFIVICGIVTALFAISCSNDPDGTSDKNPLTPPDTSKKDTTKPEVPVPEYVGNWLGTFPAIPGKINDSVRITVLINKDSTFKLNAIYLTTKDTALRDNGTWKVSN